MKRELAEGRRNIRLAADKLEKIAAQILPRISSALPMRDALILAQQEMGKQGLSEVMNGCSALANAFGLEGRWDMIGLATPSHDVRNPDVGTGPPQTSRAGASIPAPTSAHSR